MPLTIKSVNLDSIAHKANTTAFADVTNLYEQEISTDRREYPYHHHEKVAVLNRNEIHTEPQQHVSACQRLSARLSPSFTIKRA